MAVGTLSVVLATLFAPTAAITIAQITKCQDGVTDLVGDGKFYTVQICNLFGATCYVNQVELASADCATGALQIEHQTCALFPIKSYQNYDRTDPAKLQVGGTQCAISCSGTDCKFSGACVSIQCSLGGGTFAGPGTKAGVAYTLADIYEANAWKTNFLSRADRYVAMWSQTTSSTGTNTYTVGSLPFSTGNNYGPKACPSSTALMSSSAGTGITKEELRMCGGTGKWIYYAAINLLMDKTMTSQYSGNAASGDAVGTSKVNVGDLDFLEGNAVYTSEEAMDNQREWYLWDGTSTSGTPLLTSAVLTPAKSPGMATPSPDIAGTWRTYGVAFYCTDYARADLTTCPSANRAMFYVADPNPAPQYGTAVTAIGAGGTTVGTASFSCRQAATSVLLLGMTVFGKFF